MIMAERIRALLSYDYNTGIFIRIAPTSNRIKIGEEAGTLRRDGYRRVKVDGRLYMAHRLAWLYMTGAWPTAEIDHADLNRENNSWRNLRQATRAQNMSNCHARSNGTSGLKGVSLHKDGKYQATIGAGGEIIYLGLFHTAEAAHAAYCAAAHRLHGDFARFA
ncbi:MAG: HNH endonuclease signature motif containing protein [Methylocella sp.]